MTNHPRRANASGQASQTATLLKKVLAHVLIAAEGQEQNLDAAISNVRGQLRSGELQPITVSQLSNASGALGAIRRNRADKMLRGYSACVAQLLKLEPPEDIRKELAAFMRHARRYAVRPDEQEATPLKLSRLQAETLEWLTGQSAEGVDAEMLESEQYDEKLFEDDSLAGLPPYSSVAEAVENVLANMLVQIRVPDPGIPALEKAHQILGAGLNWYELAALLEQISIIVQLSLNNDQQEFELFLHDLNQRLTALNGGVCELENVTGQLISHNHSLDEGLRQGISDIASGISNASSMDALKSSVLGSLDTVIGQLDSFSDQRGKIEQQYEEQINALNERICELEKVSKRADEEIQSQQRRSETDSLTGLPNRCAYDRRLDIEFERWQRYQQDFSLVIADIDHFKAVNDEYGHLAGDKVLSVVAKTIHKRLRRVDFIARYGGEEFVIILPGTRADQALELMQALGASIRKCPFHYDKAPLEITVSFGIAVISEDDTTESLFSRADKALYAAKAAGRDTCIVGEQAA